MKSLALIVIILIATSNATSLFDRYPMNFSKKRSIMAVLTQVEAALKNHGPMDAITRMLDEFVTEVTNEQVQHDNLYAEQQVQCEDEIGFRLGEIEAANAALAEATQTLDGCNSQKVRAVQDLTVTKKQLGENRQILGQVEETRRREKFAFATATEVYQLTTRAVDEALVILEQIFSGEAGFIQLAKHVNGMLKSAVQIRQAHLLTGVMSALSQMATKDLAADEALLEQVKSMLSNFRDKVETKYQEKCAVEASAVEAYNMDKARLEGAIEHLTTARDELKAEIAALDLCQATQQGIVFAATKKRDRNQKLLDDGNSLCGTIHLEYETATAQRTEELELLGEIKARVEVRFSQMGEYVTQRGEQDEFETEEW